MNNDIFGSQIITSKSNPLVKEVIELSEKKFRNNKKLFKFDGIKLFKEAIDFKLKIRYIVLENEKEFTKDTVELIKAISNDVKIFCVRSDIFEKMTDEMAPQGIITVCEFSVNCRSIDSIGMSEKAIIFESIRDPGNLGTILRSAVAFGINNVVLTDDCVDIYSSKVIRSSMGAFFKLNIYQSENIHDAISYFKTQNRRVIATVLDKKSLILGKDKIDSTDVFVFGNEGHGLNEETIKECTDSLFIPIENNTESLNVASASSVIMWEISKK